MQPDQIDVVQLSSRRGLSELNRLSRAVQVSVRQRRTTLHPSNVTVAPFVGIRIAAYKTQYLSNLSDQSRLAKPRLIRLLRFLLFGLH